VIVLYEQQQVADYKYSLLFRTRKALPGKKENENI